MGIELTSLRILDNNSTSELLQCYFSAPGSHSVHSWKMPILAKNMKYNLKDTMKLHFMDDYYKPLKNLFLKIIVLILSSAVRAATFVEYLLSH